MHLQGPRMNLYAWSKASNTCTSACESRTGKGDIQVPDGTDFMLAPSTAGVMHILEADNGMKRLVTIHNADELHIAGQELPDTFTDELIDTIYNIMNWPLAQSLKEDFIDELIREEDEETDE